NALKPATSCSVSIRTAERLIVALDVPDVDAAKALVRTLGDTVVFYKIGLELAMSGRYFELLDWLLEQGKRVFADLKFYDIPATVGAAVRQIRHRGATFLTVHGERSILEAAAREKGDLKILAVTVLTSVEQADLARVGIDVDIETLARRRAADALAAGCDGVIASGQEARQLRQEVGADALIVTPGIRPADATPGSDDQRRIVTPRAAFEAGADYIVVGRPIRAARDPLAAARSIQQEIADCFV